jgi:hypothetical protein
MAPARWQRPLFTLDARTVRFEEVDEAIPAHVARIVTPPLFADPMTPTVRLPSPSVKTQKHSPGKWSPSGSRARHFLQQAKGAAGVDFAPRTAWKQG